MSKKFRDYKFGGNCSDAPAIASFDPEAIAGAIEKLGENYAIANQGYEQAKHEAERVLAELTSGYKKVAGSISGAEALAKASDKYQHSLKVLRETEAEKIKAQASYRASEAYSKMVITKVSTEGKMGEYYKKNLVA